MPKAKNENRAIYGTAHRAIYGTAPGNGMPDVDAENLIIAHAICILRERMKDRQLFSCPKVVRDWLKLRLAEEPREHFLVLCLDAQNQLLSDTVLFSGTLTQTSIYPREVVKLALKDNAAGVIFAHNHPSGIAEPSHADELLTGTLKQALALVDVRVLDHFIVGRENVLSFAERGLL